MTLILEQHRQRAAAIRAGIPTPVPIPAKRPSAVKPWWRHPLRSAGSMTRVLTSPLVDDAEYERRMAACRTCPDSRSRGTELFCSRCGCPHSRLSALAKKNRYAGHKCPRAPPRF